MILFNLKNIKCKYPGTFKEVLSIEELKIHKGKLTFLVGESGVGKSTLLETLGMMNNTISDFQDDKSQFSFFPFEDQKSISLNPYWKFENETLLNELRNSYFSFVFQNNNLMDSFSAIENVMLSSLIQGKSIKEAELVAKESLKKFDILEFSNNSTKKLSGGQKQRFAFARAFAKDYTVIFGDEPTGNLDPVNADNLLNELTNSIHDSNLKKGAVIVSHDIDRTIRFADHIIIINSSVQNNHKIGLINNESLFVKSNTKWSNFKDEIINNKEMKELLIGAMTKNKIS